jgi:hypothetical protein
VYTRIVILILTHPSLINEYPHKLQSVSSKNTAEMIDSLTTSFMTLLIHISPAYVFTNSNKGDVEPPGIPCLHNLEYYHYHEERIEHLLDQYQVYVVYQINSKTFENDDKQIQEELVRKLIKLLLQYID